MGKYMPLIVIGFILLIGIGGFIAVKQGKQAPKLSTTTTPYTVSTQKASGTVKEDLTFSGTVNGRMTEGRRGDTYACLTTVTGPIVGKIGDTDYTFEYRALTANGPGTYKAYVQIGPLNNKNLYYGADNTDLTINPDRRSGKVEGDLSNLTNSSQKVRISGNWTCPPDY